MFNHSKYYLLLVLGATIYFTGCQAGGEWTVDGQIGRAHV